MSSKVYFIPVQGGAGVDVLTRSFSRLIGASQLMDPIMERDFVAVKFHFGEKGNTGHLKPEVVKVAVDRAKSVAKWTFVADTNTLYRGQRANSVDHLRVAQEHGFSLESLGVPVLIADGLKGRSYIEIEVKDCIHYRTILVASDFANTDFLVSLAHVTGHCATGMGAAIKNIGMGCTSRQAKLSMHQKVKPKVNPKICIRCGLCAKWCPADAITVTEISAAIDSQRCIGCGECTVLCRTGAVSVQWGESSRGLQEKLAENALGVCMAVERRMAFFNFLTFIEKDCDCLGQPQDRAIDDIGILASSDPVAADQAALDLVNKQAGKEFFKSLFKDVDPSIQLAHGEKIGLGSRRYDLVQISL